LNEVFTETDARKAQALVELARTLVAAHVPIDGVGFQGHLFTPFLQPVAPDATSVADAMRAIATLGLKVAVTEIDAPTFPDTPDRFVEQARRVRALVEACLGVRRCTDVIFWDLQDAESWLKHLVPAGRPRADPLRRGARAETGLRRRARCARGSKGSPARFSGDRAGAVARME
jgi:endo-1,4-beta-xylanase